MPTSRRRYTCSRERVAPDDERAHRRNDRIRQPARLPHDPQDVGPREERDDRRRRGADHRAGGDIERVVHAHQHACERNADRAQQKEPAETAVEDEHGERRRERDRRVVARERVVRHVMHEQDDAARMVDERPVVMPERPRDHVQQQTEPDGERRRCGSELRLQRPVRSSEEPQEAGDGDDREERDRVVGDRGVLQAVVVPAESVDCVEQAPVHRYTKVASGSGWPSAPKAP